MTYIQYYGTHVSGGSPERTTEENRSYSATAATKISFPKNSPTGYDNIIFSVKWWRREDMKLLHFIQFFLIARSDPI